MMASVEVAPLPAPTSSSSVTEMSCLWSGLDARRGQGGRGGHEALRVGVLGVLEDLQGGAGFDDAAAVHDDELLGALGGQAEVVRNEQHGGAHLAGELAEVVEDAALDGDVQGGGRLVGDQQLGVRGHADGDEGALAHATGEFVRVLIGAACRVGQAGFLEEGGDALAGLGAGHDVVREKGLLDLRAHAEHGVEVTHRVLGDEADAGPAQLHPLPGGQVGDVAAVELDLSARDLAGAGQQADDGGGGRGLTGAGLADDGDGLAGVDGQVRAAHGGDDAGRGGEGDLQVRDLEQGLRVVRVDVGRGRGRAGGDGSFDDLFHLLVGELGGVRFAHLRAFGSRASRTASPIMMKLRTVRARAAPG